MIQNSGIAGTNHQAFTNEEGHLTKVTIKCLHTHFAHFCSTNADRNIQQTPHENPTGRIAHVLLRKNFPSLQL